MNKGFDRHVILLTDGQVYDSQAVIDLMGRIKDKNIATVHTVGVGDGISFDMIKRGANRGGGQYLFVMDNSEMQKQIIYLLEMITKFKISSFNIEYNQQIIECTEPLIPYCLEKGVPNNFFLLFKRPLSAAELDKELITVSYID